MISAICDDYLKPRILLGVSSADSVTDYWNLYRQACVVALGVVRCLRVVRHALLVR